MDVTAEAVKQQAFGLGFHKVGIARADALDADIEHLQRWLALGYCADMHWMADPRRQDVRRILPGVRSVVVVAMNYNFPAPNWTSDAGIARYARGRDYHKVLGGRLRRLARWLDGRVPGSINLFFVDSGPIQEKAWAQAAGIGWIGKNACLLTRDYGSWVFLGTLLTTLVLDPDAPHANHCGTCTRCLEACPTRAFAAPAVLDARRCLAYHTIENRDGPLPPEVVEHQHGWVVGCDICQTCCPFNQQAERLGRTTDIADFAPREPWPHVRLAQLADVDAATYDRWTVGSAVRRVRIDLMRRNASAALATKRDPDGAKQAK
jgi:epoxyqueuosine reductase